MSHHLDSPLAREDPRLDISDVFVFRGEAGTAFVVDVNPVSGAGGFHPEGLYEFKIDTDGDAVEDHTYRVTFGPRDGGGRQSLELRRLDGAAARDRDAAGAVVARGSTGAEIVGEGGLRIWAGPAADPFYINGQVIGTVAAAVANGTRLDPGAWQDSEAANAFAGTNVNAIVLEIPDSAFTVSEIGFWGTTALPSDSGTWRQINRCAQPLINTIFHPDDSQRSSDYNTTQPSEDRAIYGPDVGALVTNAVRAMGASGDPREHGRRTVDAIFPDILNYTIGTAANFGFVDRNGRGLTERAPEVMFGIVLNTAVPLGLDSSSAAGPPRAGFPYLAPPVDA